MAEYTGEYCYHIDVQACMVEYTGEYCYHIGVQACMVEYTGEYCIILVYKLVWLSILENTVSYWCTSLYG